MDFGMKLKELRNSKNLTQLQLSEILETSKSNISKYEAGSVEPNLDTLLKLSKIFGVPIDYILGNDNYGIDYSNYQMDTSEFGLTFKDKLKSILKDKNLSQQDFAKTTGFNSEDADAFLWGNKVPSVDELMKIAGALNVSANYLLDLPESPCDSNTSLSTHLTDKEQKYINVFRQLNEDNQDIIVGDMKKYLKEQRYEESVAANSSMREAK